MKVAVVGATGSLGREATRQLLASGNGVVTITRTPAKAADLIALGAEVRRADLAEPESLGPAIRGTDAVVDDAGHRALIDAARSCVTSP